MSTATSASDNPCCIYCNKDCKKSDSRPYPNSKSQLRIHNKCQIKKNLQDKNKQTNLASEYQAVTLPSNKSTSCAQTSNLILERAAQEELEIKRASGQKKLLKLVADRSNDTLAPANSSFFFDLKAGIAKPHEKRRYLHHRNISEIATRYDDNGFHQETIGRAYDHSGKDLNTLGDSSEDDDTNVAGTNKPHEASTRPERKKIKLDDNSPCWFCLSSPLVEKHLIIAIGEFCYLALAKGGLLDLHLLLIPIDHVDSLNNSNGNTDELLTELELFKKSLIKYFRKQDKGVVFYERNFKSVHWQLQVVPVPMKHLDKLEKNIKTISKKLFTNTEYIDIPSNCPLKDIIPQKAPYFYWQLEPIGSRFVTQIQVKGSFFPVQFGRIVLADSSILNCFERIDWKKCVKTKDEYIDLVEKIKETYREFDIT